MTGGAHNFSRFHHRLLLTCLFQLYVGPDVATLAAGAPAASSSSLPRPAASRAGPSSAAMSPAEGVPASLQAPSQAMSHSSSAAAPHQQMQAGVTEDAQPGAVTSSEAAAAAAAGSRPVAGLDRPVAVFDRAAVEAAAAARSRAGANEEGVLRPAHVWILSGNPIIAAADVVRHLPAAPPIRLLPMFCTQFRISINFRIDLSYFCLPYVSCAVPDSFFEFTSEDFAAVSRATEARKKQQSAFKTRAIREAEERSRAAAFGPVPVRFHFPDNNIMQVRGRSN